MKFEWSNLEYEEKSKIIDKIMDYKDDKIKFSEILYIDPYFNIDECIDVFLFCAKLRLFDACVYWIKNGYKNRYFSDGKSTLYYLITFVKSTKIIYETLIFWKWNESYFKLLKNTNDIEEYSMLLLYYYMKNDICPCKILRNNGENIRYYLSLKKNTLCGNCIYYAINDNHDCESMKTIFKDDKYVNSFICQNVNCMTCTNEYFSKNTLNIKNMLHIHHRKIFLKIIYSCDKVVSRQGDYEDCIDLDTIEQKEKYFKCNSNVPHYYKDTNWIKWCNSKNKKMEKCCVCNLKMDNNIYINSKDYEEQYVVNSKEYFVNINKVKYVENDKYYLKNG